MYSISFFPFFYLTLPAQLPILLLYDSYVVQYVQFLNLLNYLLLICPFFHTKQSILRLLPYSSLLPSNPRRLPTFVNFCRNRLKGYKLCLYFKILNFLGQLHFRPFDLLRVVLNRLHQRFNFSFLIKQHTYPPPVL